LKARIATNEEDVKNLPDLIRTEARFTNSQIARLSHEVAELRDLPAKVEALPRVMSELMVEMLADPKKKT
jgi:hypothetical protein